MAKKDIKDFEYDNRQSRTEAAQNGKKGGIASGKARRERKALKDTLNDLLSMPLKNGDSIDIENITSIASMKGKNITVQEAIMLGQIQKAMKGDTKAAEYIRDTIGQKPVGGMSIEVKESEKLADVFRQIGGEGLDE